MGFATGAGTAKGLQNLAMKLPKHLQAPLKLLHPSTTQLGSWPTTRGSLQTILAPVLSEKAKQRAWYPDEY